MLNIFNLQALTESAGSGASDSSVTAHDFTASSVESMFSQVNCSMVEACCDIKSTLVAGDEILIESVIAGNGDRQDIIVEGVMSTIQSKVSKFFAAAKSFILGIIEKLKAFFFKFTKNTSAWHTLMAPKVKKAKGSKDAGKFIYNMHNWDESMITTKMSAAALALASDDYLKNTTTTLDKIVEGKNSSISDAEGKFDSSSASAAIEELEKDAEAGTEIIMKAVNEDITRAISGISSSITFDSEADGTGAISKELYKAACGGEKLDVNIADKIDSMLSFVETTKKTITDLNSMYKKRLDIFTKAERTINSYSSKVKDTDAAKANSVTKAIIRLYSDTTSMYISVNTKIGSVVNELSKLNINYIQECSKEYMAALSKFASLKV